MVAIFRALTAITGILMLFNGANWFLDPEVAAESLAMPLLEGMAASTQIGDLSAFFWSVAICVALAQRRGARQWLVPAALLLGSAAVGRTLATILGHAPFGAQFIVPEVLMTAILVGTYRLRMDEDETST